VSGVAPLATRLAGSTIAEALGQKWRSVADPRHRADAMYSD
jgi:hypothetical protein